MILELPAETLVTAALLIPVLGALLLPVFHRWPNLREAVTLITSVCLAVVVWNLYPLVIEGARPEVQVATVAPGLEFAFKVEPLGLLFGLIASTLWIVNSIYSIGYMRGNDEPRQTQFYVCFAIAIAATIGLAFSANLFTMFLFYEALTLSTFPLVTHKRSEQAMKGGRLYLMMLVGTSMVLFLPAIMITWALAGTLDFAPGGILEGKAGGWVIGVLLGLFVFGIGKAAVMPFHFWLPAAMVAPTPVSALLHAVAVVKAGVFSILKVVVYIFGLDLLSGSESASWLVWVAGGTVLVASIVALRQDNLKRRLAYSTVSQLSYVVLAAAMFAPVAAIGAAMHIAGHAVSKITLFFAAGSIYTASKKTEISQLDGIGWRMPWTMGAFCIGALAMIGLPPTAGFLSKWFMLGNAMETQNWVPATVIVLSTLLNASYFLPILFRAYFVAERLPQDGLTEPISEAPFAVVLPICITATLTILLFLYPQVVLDLVRLMVAG